MSFWWKCHASRDWRRVRSGNVRKLLFVYGVRFASLLGIGESSAVHHEPLGRTLIFNDHGEMIVAELSPKKYHEVSRMSIIDPTHTVSGCLLV